jgi:hypothetical protein
MAHALKARLLGIAITVAGLATAWFFGVRPLQAAAAVAPEIEFQMKLFLVAPMAIGGSSVGEAFSGPPVGRQQHLIVWTMFSLALVAGGFSYWWFEGQLSALGYVGG